MALELVDRALDDVALLVAVRVERGWAACAAAATYSVARLIRGLGDGRSDPASSQVGTDRPAGVGLMGRQGCYEIKGSWPDAFLPQRDSA